MRTSTDTKRKVAEEQAEICKIFSNPKRILILWALAQNELVVGDIAALVGTTVQNTSHHLRIMKDRGILYANRIGQNVAYGIECRECVEQLLKKVTKIAESPVESKTPMNIE